MIIVMKPYTKQEQIDKVIDTIKSLGLSIDISHNNQITTMRILGDTTLLKNIHLELMAGVEKLIPVTPLYKLASKVSKFKPSIINVDGVKIGGKEIVVMAGPCAVENEKQLLDTAKAVKNSGAKILRGGAYKPRTSPYSFQGLKEKGLKYLASTKKETGLKIITEVVSEKSLEIAEKYTDMLQIGTRNMQNFQLLKAVGKSKKPVLLKRGFSSTIDEWLNAAEYIMSEGNLNVILCERGIRTFETATRNTLDISAIPVLKSKTHLPVVVDPSHASGKWEYIIPLCMAAIAAGADGLLVEVHTNPKCALSDGAQSLIPKRFVQLCENIQRLAPVVGREYKILD